MHNNRVENINQKELILELEEMRRKNSELEKNEEKYKLLFDKMDSGFALHKIVLNDKGAPIDYIFIDINDAFTKLTNLKRENIIGKKVTEVLSDIENDTVDWISTYGQVVLTGNSINFENYSETLKKWYSILAYKMDEEQFAVLIHDVTKRKQIELTLKKSKEQLVQAQKMEAIGILAGGIAHDFNNILGVIMGYTELTLDSPEVTKVTIKNMKRIMSASERAKDMVKQILAFSRKDDQTMMSVNIGKIIKEVIVFLRSSIPTTIEIEVDIEKDLGLVFGNATQINQVLMNLCTNASYAMKDDGGVLKIDLKEVVLDKESAAFLSLEPGIYQQLIVSDNGIGISKEIIDRIFEPYFTTKGINEGTGMGLAVIYGIMKSHKGSINVYSEQGKGTVFNVYFPLMDIDKPEKKTDVIHETFIGNNESILFVDDEIALVELGEQMLKNLGYRVDKRTSSIEALEAFKFNSDKYDLIITDMTMPNMTGVQLASEIHKIRSDVPIILCTGFSDRISKNNYTEKGISALVMKPILKSELSKVIQKILKIKR